MHQSPRYLVPPRSRNEIHIGKAYSFLVRTFKVALHSKYQRARAARRVRIKLSFTRVA